MECFAVMKCIYNVDACKTPALLCYFKETVKRNWESRFCFTIKKVNKNNC